MSSSFIVSTAIFSASTPSIIDASVVPHSFFYHLGRSTYQSPDSTSQSLNGPELQTKSKENKHTKTDAHEPVVSPQQVRVRTIMGLSQMDLFMLHLTWEIEQQVQLKSISPKQLPADFTVLEGWSVSPTPPRSNFCLPTSIHSYIRSFFHSHASWVCEQRRLRRAVRGVPERALWCCGALSLWCICGASGRPFFALWGWMRDQLQPQGDEAREPPHRDLASTELLRGAVT